MFETILLLRLIIYTLHIYLCRCIYHDYIIVGGGIGGVSLGYYLENSELSLDYIVLEKEFVAGSLFNKYPIHDSLLSINKFRTGYFHKELNLRHDWNSLLSINMSNNNDSLYKFRYNTNSKINFTMYSNKYYPLRNELVNYINDYVQMYNIKIKYDTYVNIISQKNNQFFLETRSGASLNSSKITNYECKYLFIATGLFKPHIPSINGIEYAIGYEDLSKNLTLYENKKVAIFGSGNSAFEIAQHISQVTAHTHIIMRSYPKFAYETHYVGDLRSINLEIIDHYLLKSMDAFIDQLNVSIHYCPDKNKYYLRQIGDVYPFRAWELRDGYDIIIRATGFEFEYSIFDNDLLDKIYNAKNKKYPLMDNKFKAKNVANLFFVGCLMHDIDYKKSAGGFIHGYRYYIKALYSSLIDQFQNNKIIIKNEEITKYLLVRANTASSLYQMFGYMSDFVLIMNNDDSYYYYDLLVSQINDLIKIKNCINDCIGVISLFFNYHPEFHGHYKVFEDPNRIHEDYRTGQHSNFLHPIVRYYSCNVLSTTDNFDNYLISEHHLIEDFLIRWNLKRFHVQHLTRWIVKQTNIQQIINQTELDNVDSFTDFYF
eukprot:157834_1